MKTKRLILRPAIAMIELIIAIVVIGIVLMSAPMLLQQAAKSGYVAIQQEAINEAASQVNMVLGYHWDENSADERFIDPILTAAGGDTNLIEYNNTGRRAGTPKESKRAFVRDDGLRLPASALGSDGGDRDDIDDLAGNAQLTLIEDAASDYVEKTTIDINTSISYISDAISGGTYLDPGGDKGIVFTPSWTPSANSTNIKHIQVMLTSSSGHEELEKQIVLHAFSCNIGATTLEEREF